MNDVGSLGSMLSEEQQKHRDTVKWLISSGHHRRGRTTLLAVCFIEEALETGQRVHVFDHTRYPRSVDHIFREVDIVARTMKNVDVMMYRCDRSIEAKHIKGESNYG